MQMDDISLDEEELEESGNNDTDFASESDSSGSDFYERQIVPMVYIYLMNTFINLYSLNLVFLSFLMSWYDIFDLLYYVVTTFVNIFFFVLQKF